MTSRFGALSSPLVLAVLGFVASVANPACSSDAAPDHAPRVDANGDGRPGDSTVAPAGTDPSADGGPDLGPAVPYMPFDVNHVLSTGQSNSVANDGNPALSTTQTLGNLMFDVGVMTAQDCDGDGCRVNETPRAFTALVEGDMFFGYPVETMSSGLANQTATFAKARGLSHTMLVSLHGRSGNSYWCLRKGFCTYWPPSRGYVAPFDEAMRQVRDAKAIATATNKSYVVRAATAIHGEADHYAYTGGTSDFPLDGTDRTPGAIKDYTDALLEWQRDYEAGAKAITAQQEPVPLFINQYSHWNNAPTTKIAFMQLDAHVKSAGKVVVVGPTYQLDYYDGGDGDTCLHFTNASEQRLGEYFAKAYARVVIEGRPWEPLRPTSVTLAGNVVTAKFVVTRPPLVLDVRNVSDPGNFGFEWSDASASPPTITKVELAGPDTVKITLAIAPTGADKRLRYAYTFDGCLENKRTGARGNLRDSDATTSLSGGALFNWAVHFDASVP